MIIEINSWKDLITRQYYLKEILSKYPGRGNLTLHVKDSYQKFIAEDIDTENIDCMKEIFDWVDGVKNDENECPF